MCFSSGRQFFYFGGAFDLSWLPWTVKNIAAEDRRRRGVTTGPQSTREAPRSGGASTGARRWRGCRFVTSPRSLASRRSTSTGSIIPMTGRTGTSPIWNRRHSQVRVPIFNFSGWHDEGYGPIGAVRNFTGLRDRAATPDARSPRLMIGPWVHGSPGTGRVGARDFTNGAAIDYPRLVLDWCDLHARGIDRGLGSEPPVRRVRHGRERVAHVADVAAAVHAALVLPACGWPADDRSAGRRRGARQLHVRSEPPVEDPHYDEGLGPRDQRAIEARADVLTFTTPPLEEDVEVIGHIEFRLWIASSAPDTDFICRLIDVEPDGTAWNLMSPTLEVLRAKYRHGETEPVYLTPGRPEELTLRLGLTANRFLRGHRIRVQVMSSFFPHLDRNPNTGRPSAIESRLVPARQTIFHDASRPSRVILPVV